MSSEKLDQDRVVVRRLRPEDLESVVALDARIVGRRRAEYFRIKLEQARHDTGIVLSLAAEYDGLFAGFLLARVYYGEFGLMEPVAVLDTIGVHSDFRGAGIGHALLDQLCTDLRGLNVTRVRTEVAWEEPELMMFFHHEGFRPAARLCLDLDLSRPRPERSPA